MERESFEEEDVAALLNEHFVAIKVDREERPDIDHIYMLFCQALTGHGGWPLTIFMTPDKKPFYAGTYFPKHNQYGQPGLMEILPKISRMWKEQKGELERSSQELFHIIQDSAPGGETPKSQKILFTAHLMNSGRPLTANTEDFPFSPNFRCPIICFSFCGTIG